MELADLDLNKLYSYADYYKWRFKERVELIKGKIFRITTPNPVHQEILGNIFTSFKLFFNKDQYKVFFAPFDVRLTNTSNNGADITTVLQPDICVVCDRQKIDNRGCIGAPDLVVEVLGPGNSTKELKNKYDVYEEAGVKEYWIVSPQNQNFLIYTLVDGKFQLSPIKVPGDIVTSSVLPGFSIDLAELFIDVDPDHA